jgi:RNA polymerase sigma-70 factor (ECF subfamily)
MDESDDALIRRCRRGDTEAFGTLVKRYAGRATGLALVLVGNYPDALDVSQEAFVRAWRHIGKFRGDASFFAWYASILRKVSLTWLRRRRKGVALVEAAAVPASGADPAVLAEQNEQAQRLWHAVLELPTKHREIIVLSHFQRLSYKEIADVLEIPIGTVMSRLHAARVALRAKLSGERP